MTAADSALAAPTAQTKLSVSATAASAAVRAALDANHLQAWGVSVEEIPPHLAGVCLACCDHERMQIVIDASAAELFDEEDRRQIALHEVAHALTPGDGHGPAWHDACVRLGGDGKMFRPPARAAEAMGTIERLMRDYESRPEDSYTPVATLRLLVDGQRLAQRIMAWRLLVAGKTTAEVRQATGLSTGQIGAIRAWNTMYSSAWRDRKGAR